MTRVVIILSTIALVIALFIIMRLVAGDGSVNGVPVAIEAPGVGSHVSLERDANGRLWYLFVDLKGDEQRVSPDAFAQALYETTRASPWWALIFNISSPVGMIWVGLGLLGQVLFTGRMVVQWLVSEKERRSVVPTAFWWMSLIGASMLLTYFVWRVDLVGVLGQATGWVIYVRNLWLIYRNKRDAINSPVVEPGVDADEPTTAV